MRPTGFCIKRYRLPSYYANAQRNYAFHIDFEVVGSGKRVGVRICAPVEALQRLWRWENAVCPDDNPKADGIFPAKGFAT